MNSESVVRLISYGKHPLQQMDVHFPKDYSPQTPVVFLIHGGGFIVGRKEDFEVPASLFCLEGFVVVNLSHRLVDANWFSKSGASKTGGTKITDQLDDVDDAVRLYKNQAAGWGVGTERMYIA